MKLDKSDIFDEKKLAELETKIKESKSKLEKLVKDYPLASVAVALGLGFTIAKLLKRRN